MTEPAWGIRPRRYPGRLPERADVLVVGGGITGVSLLHWLRGRADAVLVERDRIAAGASGRNAGFLTAGAAGCHAAAVRRHGRSRAGALHAFTVETHELLAEALAGRSPAYRRIGSCMRAADPEEADVLEESCELLREDGFDAGWDGAIREGVTVERLEAGPDGVRVIAGRRECRAGAVVLATNAYTRLLAPEVPIEPVRAQMAATGPAAPGLMDLPTSSDRGYGYWRQLADGRVLAGGYRDRAMEEEVGYEAVPTRRVQAHLDAHLHALGAGRAITHRWAGIMGFTADELPIVGPLAGRPDVWVCGGYTGRGLAFAFHCARRLADALTGSRPATGLLP